MTHQETDPRASLGHGLGGQHGDKVLVPIANQVFYPGLPVGNTGHCNYLPAHPTQSSCLMTFTLTQSVGAATSLSGWSKPHGSLAFLLGPASLLIQHSAVST